MSNTEKRVKVVVVRVGDDEYVFQAADSKRTSKQKVSRNRMKELLWEKIFEPKAEKLLADVDEEYVKLQQETDQNTETDFEVSLDGDEVSEVIPEDEVFGFKPDDSEEK